MSIPEAINIKILPIPQEEAAPKAALQGRQVACDTPLATEDKYKETQAALFGYVKRVSEGGYGVTEAESAVLPQMVKLLLKNL